MARPTKQRRICKAPAYCEFGPIGKVDDQEPIVLDVTEYECLRLIDYLGLTQEECARISFRIDSDCSLEELEQRVRFVVRQLEDKQLIDN